MDGAREGVRQRGREGGKEGGRTGEGRKTGHILVLFMDPEGNLFQEEGGIARPEACTSVKKDLVRSKRDLLGGTEQSAPGESERERARARGREGEKVYRQRERERERAQTSDIRQLTIHSRRERGGADAR
jgi:hypothetical protein